MIWQVKRLFSVRNIEKLLQYLNAGNDIWNDIYISISLQAVTKSEN